MSATLRRNSIGADVKAMQESLHGLGFTVGVDGVFGPGTEIAVKAFQRKNGLLPDGIAGPQTLGLLDKLAAGGTAIPLMNANALTQRFGGALNSSIVGGLSAPAGGSAAQPVSHLHMSDSGLDFLYHLEAYRGVSNHLYWPKGASGVTLGAGYDMRERSSTEIERDMLGIGLDAATAKIVGGGAGLSGAEAKKFASDNHKLVDLSEVQERNLLKLIVPKYENIVHSHIKVAQTQYQFDALVSFAYNPGGRMSSTSAFINKGEIAKAMAKIKEAVTSGGEVMDGLVKRRDKEVNLYLYGSYGGHR